jgi:hypothetical protein
VKTHALKRLIFAKSLAELSKQMSEGKSSMSSSDDEKQSELQIPQDESYSQQAQLLVETPIADDSERDGTSTGTDGDNSEDDETEAAAVPHDEIQHDGK